MECYQCGNTVPLLNNRSRCIDCETSRSNFNADQNEKLRGQLDEAQCYLGAFRHAANSIALTTGVIVSHVDHKESSKSVIGDHYFLELIAEAELRYKQLRDVADRVAIDYASACDIVDVVDIEAGEGVQSSRELLGELQGLLR